jgi:hypothetical protein
MIRRFTSAQFVPANAGAKAKNPGVQREPGVTASPSDSSGRVRERRSFFRSRGVLKTGATLVRQWRGHTHTVLVREDGFEYDGQRYRSLTVIAERITGAHWSGPRFFATGNRARAS